MVSDSGSNLKALLKIYYGCTLIDTNEKGTIMEDPNLIKPESPGLVINDRMLDYLMVVRNWAMFLSIIGFILIGLLLSVGFIMVVFMRNPEQPFGSAIQNILYGAVYLVFAIVYFFPVLFLYRFAKSAKIGIEHRDINRLEDGFKNLKILFLIVGVLALGGIFLGFFVIFVNALPWIAWITGS